jgi:hypothetical protein
MATKTKLKKKTKTPSALEQAQAEMDVKYKPQINAAQSLLGEAADQYKSDIETAKNNTAAITAFARAQERPTIDRYKEAATQVAANEANTASALGGVGPASDIFRRAITGTQGTIRSQQTGAGTRASQALSDRQVAAQAGGIAAQQQARKDYRKTKNSLTSQIQSLTGQRQADVINRFGQIAEKDAERQKDIDVANIAADARRDVAGSSATNAANKAAAAKREKEAKRVGGVRKATGDLKQSVANAVDQWDLLANAKAPKTNPAFDKSKPLSETNKPYLNPDGNPVADPANAEQISPSAAAIKARLTTGDKAIDPGVLHIALLVRADKPLDDAAIRYIKANPDWRIPREWLRNKMDKAIAENRAAGPPRPGVS